MTAVQKRFADSERQLGQAKLALEQVHTCLPAAAESETCSLLNVQGIVAARVIF